MITLHYYPGNASMTPHILLREIGVPFALQLVDRSVDAHKSPEYLKLNPNGLIPVMVDGDIVLYETAAIGLHLVDRYPQAGLAPAVGSAERAHFYKWLVWLTNTLQSTLMLYFYPGRLVDGGDAAVAAAISQGAHAKVVGMLQQLDDQLASHGRPWVLGDDYSLVDIYAFMLCRWTRGFATKPAREFPHLGPFLQRMLERPTVRKTIEVEGWALPLV